MVIGSSSVNLLTPPELCDYRGLMCKTSLTTRLSSYKSYFMNLMCKISQSPELYGYRSLLYKTFFYSIFCTCSLLLCIFHFTLTQKLGFVVFTVAGFSQLRFWVMCFLAPFVMFSRILICAVLASIVSNVLIVGAMWYKQI